MPRTHDIRHSFAVNVLLRWYTYMGHVSIVSTERYLHVVDELAAHASDRFNAHYGDVIVPLPKGQGGGQ